jgi:hypothetical protein
MGYPPAAPVAGAIQVSICRYHIENDRGCQSAPVYLDETDGFSYGKEMLLCFPKIGFRR